MTAQLPTIVREVRQRVPVSSDSDVIPFLADACANVLANPYLPGEGWRDQIVLEVVRLVRESQRVPGSGVAVEQSNAA